MTDLLRYAWEPFAVIALWFLIGLWVWRKDRK